MLEPRENPCLALEADGRFVGGLVGAEHLERYLAGQGPVECTVHRPHPAMPDRLANLVAIARKLGRPQDAPEMR
jgi:hypothetical protein